MGSLFAGPKIKTPRAVRALGKADAVKDLKPVSVNAGGLSSSFANGRISLNSSGSRNALVNSLASQFTDQAKLVAGLRGTVAPSMSNLRKARLTEIENARSASMSNLRDNLARRRVLGSSFGADAMTRSELEFAQQKDKVAADSYLQELDLTNQLIDQEFNLRRGSYNTKLGEMNLQADVAAGMAAEASKVLQSSAQFRTLLATTEAELRSKIGIAQSDLDAKAQEGAGALIGKVAGSLLGPAGSVIGEKIGTALV